MISMSRLKTRVISLFTLAIAAAFLIISCSGGSSTGGSTLEKVQESGVVKIGYANEAPYGYQDTATGEITGEAPEIAKAVLAEMGINEIEGVLTEFGSLIPGLQAGRFDMIAAGMYINPDRCEQILFSDPSYGIGEGMIVQSGNPKGVTSYDDIANNPDITLGVVAGTVEQGYAEATGIPADQVEILPDAPSAVEAVKAGRVDAYAGTSLTVQDLVDKDQSGDVERAEPFSDPVIDGEEIKGYGAFGFRKEDEEFRNAFNEQLNAFIGTQDHLDLVRPFGFTESELPEGKTAEELCQA
ncbi:MAG: ectoine/hydroxyectoine ABC transporter substrate-binding protein EhuB [Elainellaceae cyanobacterium]